VTSEDCVSLLQVLSGGWLGVLCCVASTGSCVTCGYTHWSLRNTHRSRYVSVRRMPSDTMGMSPYGHITSSAKQVFNDIQFNWRRCQRVTKHSSAVTLTVSLVKPLLSAVCDCFEVLEYRLANYQ